MPALRRHRRLLVQGGPLVLGNWGVFAILSIWAPVEVLIVAVALLAFVASATLGAFGVVLSSLAVAVIAVSSELASSHPLSAHRFLTSGSLAVCLLVLCGLVGCTVRVLFRRLDAKRKDPGSQVRLSDLLCVRWGWLVVVSRGFGLRSGSLELVVLRASASL
jgi:hypothetical protein